jgi:hypothetical protein
MAHVTLSSRARSLRRVSANFKNEPVFAWSLSDWTHFGYATTRESRAT